MKRILFYIILFVLCTAGITYLHAAEGVMSISWGESPAVVQRTFPKMQPVYVSDIGLNSQYTMTNDMTWKGILIDTVDLYFSGDKLKKVVFTLSLPMVQDRRSQIAETARRTIGRIYKNTRTLDPYTWKTKQTEIHLQLRTGAHEELHEVKIVFTSLFWKKHYFDIE